MGFNANGQWTIHQSNGPVVAFDMDQEANGELSGAALVDGTSGVVKDGRVGEDNIFFTVNWTNGTKGRYTGTLGPDRRLSGAAFDLSNPSSQATWFTAQPF